MAKPTAAEITKLKERIAGLSDDERAAVLEAMEPDIIKKVMALLAGAPAPEPKPDPEPKPKPTKRPWWDIFGEGE